jgi:hypothetical protein
VSSYKNHIRKGDFHEFEKSWCGLDIYPSEKAMSTGMAILFLETDNPEEEPCSHCLMAIANLILDDQGYLKVGE